VFDANEDEYLVEQFNVSGFPTFMFFQDGNRYIHRGADESALREYIQLL